MGKKNSPVNCDIAWPGMLGAVLLLESVAIANLGLLFILLCRPAQTYRIMAHWNYKWRIWTGHRWY